MESTSSEKQPVSPFSAVTDAEWLEVVRSELRGRDLEETLTWHTPDGFDLRAFYRRTDGNANRTPVPMRGPGKPWTIRDVVTAGDSGTEQASLIGQIIRQSRDEGAEEFTLDVRHVLDTDDAAREQWSDAVRNLDHEAIQPLLHIDAGRYGPGFLADCFPDGLPPGGSLLFDPAAFASLTDTTAAHEWAAGTLSGITRSRFRLCAADGLAAHMLGANGVSELAWILSSLSDWMNGLTELGLAPGLAARSLHVRTAVGTSYFPAMARLRALRLGLAQVLAAYGISGPEAVGIPVHAVVIPREVSLYDTYGNLLRATTAVAASVIGGADSIEVVPFDRTGGDPKRTRRLSRNVQLVLRHEGHLHRVADPSAGSWYVEAATDQIGEAAWSLFQAVEQRGGMARSEGRGILLTRIEAESADRDESIGSRRRMVIGVNQYPEPADSLLAKLQVSGVLQHKDPSDVLAELRSEALNPIEALRLDVEMARLAGHGPGPLLLVRFRASPIVAARAAFIRSFVGCIGLIPDEANVDDLEHLTEWARSASGAAILLCAEDPEIPEAALAIRAGSPGCVLMAAGRPPDDQSSLWHADASIHRESPLLRTLQDLLVRAGWKLPERPTDNLSLPDP